MTPEGLVALGYVAVLCGIAVYDARTRRAPNRVVYPALALALLASLALGADAAVEALLGGLAAFAVLLVVALVGRGRMGLGDTKVGALCGMAVGLGGLAPMLAISFVSGGAVAAVALGLRLRRREDAIAFTPFLAAGVLGALLWFETYLGSS